MDSEAAGVSLVVVPSETEKTSWPLAFVRSAYEKRLLASLPLVTRYLFAWAVDDLIQASTVTEPFSRPVMVETVISEFVPLKLNAWPTLPATNETLLAA